MRYLFPIACVVLAVVGLLFGALNPTAVAVDFYWIELRSSLGVALLTASLLGAALAGLVLWAAVILPQGRRLARANRLGARQAPLQDQAIAAPKVVE